MINVLIIENKLEIAKNIINNIGKYDNIKICGIIETEEEIIDVIKDMKIDLIIKNNIRKSDMENIANKKECIIIQKNDREALIKEKIKQELKKINFNFAHAGTRYLLECIYLIKIIKLENIDNFHKDIYSKLSIKYNKTTNAIYGNIKQAINEMFYNCNENVLNEYLGYKSIGKPKPKEIMITVLEKI